MFMFSDVIREARFLLSRTYLRVFFVIVLILSVFSVWSGVVEVHSQQASIENLLERDQYERDSVLAKKSDYGSAAYYSFHVTYAPPEPLAFAAMGQRDIYPWKHRIRMLALEGQIYENDTINPELSFLGRFNFSFLISILAPLFVIILLHDLRSSEREAGRLDLLEASTTKDNKLWLARVIVLISALLISLITPFLVAAFYMQTNILDSFFVVLIAVAHVLFWTVLALWIGNLLTRHSQSSARIASVLIAGWLILIVIVPVVSDTIIKNTISSPSGGEIMLLQRETVNDAWDLPFAATWKEFLKTHPEFTGKTDMQSLFEWKWYYAFQQVGDDKAAELSQAYRKAILKKDAAASIVSFFSPPMLSYRLMSRLAKTDVKSLLAYEQQVRDFHKVLRMYFYPLMFNNDDYSVEIIENLPVFTPDKVNE